MFLSLSISTADSACSYPFTLSKTALTAVGSPTTYPAVLAALAWLADLLTYDAAALEPDAQLGAASLDAHDALDAAAAASAGGGAEAAFFFASVRAAYEHFLAGEDDAAAAVDARVAAAFAARHAALEGESARLREANAALRAEIAAARSGAAALPQLRGTQAALAAEVDGARRAIGGLEATRDGLNAQLLAAQRTLRDRGASYHAVMMRHAVMIRHSMPSCRHAFTQPHLPCGCLSSKVLLYMLSFPLLLASPFLPFFPLPPSSILAEGVAEGLAAALTAVTRTVASQDLTPADVAVLGARKAALREEHAGLQASFGGVQRGVAEGEAALKRDCAAVSSSAAVAVPAAPTYADARGSMRLTSPPPLLSLPLHVSTLPASLPAPPCFVQLSERLSEYAGQASKLQLLPAGAKYAFGVDFALRLNEGFLAAVTSSVSTAAGSSGGDHTGSGSALNSSMMGGAGAGADATVTVTMGHGGAAAPAASSSTTALLLGNDVKGVLRPQLRELRAKMARQAGEHNRAAAELADAAASLAEAAAEAVRTSEAAAAALRAREAALAAARCESDAVLAEASAATDALTTAVAAARSELAALSGSASSSGAASGGAGSGSGAASSTSASASSSGSSSGLPPIREEAIRGEQLRLATFAQVLAHKRAEARVRLEDAVVALAAHKDAVGDKLDALRGRVQARRDAELAAPRVTRTLPPPPTVSALHAVHATPGAHAAASRTAFAGAGAGAAAATAAAPSMAGLPAAAVAVSSYDATAPSMVPAAAAAAVSAAPMHGHGHGHGHGLPPSAPVASVGAASASAGRAPFASLSASAGNAVMGALAQGAAAAVAMKAQAHAAMGVAGAAGGSGPSGTPLTGAALAATSRRLGFEGL